VQVNFGCAIEHQLECLSCHFVSTHVEDYRDLSLDLPERASAYALRCSENRGVERGRLRADPPMLVALLFAANRAASSLRSLLQQYFSDEDVTYTCSNCGKVDAPARLRHRIYRLPRVVILHIKRFGIDMAAQEIRKRHDLVAFTETLDLGTKRCLPRRQGHQLCSRRPVRWRMRVVVPGEFCLPAVLRPAPMPPAPAAPADQSPPSSTDKAATSTGSRRSRDDPYDLTEDDKENSPMPKRRSL